MKTLLLSIVFLLSIPQDNGETTSTLTLEFTSIRSTEGGFRLGFYIDHDSFEAGDPLFERVVEKATLHDGMITATFSGIPPGIYGIAVLDDENSNNKIDYGFLFPSEGFGFSDYHHTGFTVPDFEDFDFQLEPLGKRVQVKLRYL